MDISDITGTCAVCGLPTASKYGVCQRTAACRCERARRRDAIDPGKARAREAHTKQKLHQRVFDHYGWRCTCYGSTEDLTIDHIAGGGTAHRAELFGSGRRAGLHMYRWLIANDFPEGYQTLCRPCNASKWTGERCRLHYSNPRIADLKKEVSRLQTEIARLERVEAARSSAL